MAKSLTYSEFKNRVDNCRDGSYVLLTENPTDGSRLLSRTPITVKHSCGYTFNTKFQTFVNDNKGGCQKCFPPKQAKRPVKFVTEDILRDRLAKNSPHLEYVNGYINTKTKCTFLHKDCNTIFETLPKGIFRYPNNLHCPSCSNKKIRGNYIITENYLQNLLDNTPDGKDYKWNEVYNNNNKELLTITHKVCNNTYEVSPNSFQQGNRCPHCTKNTLKTISAPMLRIMQRLNELGINYYTEYIDKRCRSKDKNGQLRFDFAIPHFDKILIIEYDGELHFEENITNNFLKKIVERTIIRDGYKNDFINKHSNEFYPIERISYKDKLSYRLDEILSKYFEFKGNSSSPKFLS